MRAIFQHRCLFTVVLILAGFLCVQVQANEQVLPENTLRGYHEFDYTFEDRPDPFLPFVKKIKPLPEVPEGKKSIDPDQVLRGLQKFEPKQLKLVAVLAFQDKNIAMLEENVTGKGHLVEQGTLIGRYGVITSIDKDKLLVTESYETPTKRKIVNKIPLYMHQQD